MSYTVQVELFSSPSYYQDHQFYYEQFPNFFPNSYFAIIKTIKFIKKQIRNNTPPLKYFLIIISHNKFQNTRPTILLSIYFTIIKLMSSEPLSLVDWLSKLGITKQLNNIDILSGITVNTTMTKILTNYTVHISTSNTASNRINNWNTVINQLQKIGIHVTQQQKNKILNGDDKGVYNILYQLKNHHEKNREQVQVDINKIDTRGDPKTSKSLLELFILVIVKYYGFSVKEAVALLSNDSKYLAHILAKGFKDNPKPVEGMLTELLKLLPQIIVFCKNKENQTFLLKSIKPGLISKFITVSQISLDLITQFTKNIDQKFQIVKNQLMATFILSLRRHSVQLRPLIKSITQILGYNKNILSLFLNHANFNETCLFMIQMLNQAEQEGQVNQIFEQFRLQQFIGFCIDNLRNSQFYINSASFILKIAEFNYSYLSQNNQNFSKIVENLSIINLSKRSDVFIHCNFIFSFLQLFGKKKNFTAPQLFKLAVDRYKTSLNEDESHNYLINFINTIQIFPSIPAAPIVQVILNKYQTSTSFIGQLELQIIESAIGNVDEKLALKVFNTITMIFVAEVGSVQIISSILEIIIKKFQTKIVFDLSVKFVKVCLAVHYANLRKLNYSKSLIQGTVKLDKDNAFYKAKNKQIQHLLTIIVKIRYQKLNKTLEPLVCYSLIQSEIKNKEESEGIKEVMLLLGDQIQLRNLYQAQAKLVLEESRNEGKNQIKKKGQSKQKGQNQKIKQIQSKLRVSSDASLLLKKKDFLYSSSNPVKLGMDVQKGLQKYTKVYLQKMAKLQMQEEKKVQQQEKKEQLRRKFTMKILQKGIKISKEITMHSLYQYGSKQKQLQRDFAVDFSHLPFYDPQFEEDRDVKAIQYMIKKYGKILKIYYNNYGGKLRPNTIKLFQDISERANLMQSANVWKLLKDHELDQFITVKEVQFIVQKINAHLRKQYRDSSLLDYQVFQNFIIQAALIMFSRPPIDLRSHPISDMFLQIIKKFKNHAQQNKIDEKIFDENQHIQTNKPQELKQLNQKLAQNPDFILPEGYKKFTVKKVIFDHKFYLEALDQSYKSTYQVLDQIFRQKLGFHIIQPYSSIIIQATAKPLLYQTQNTDMFMKERSMSSVFPKDNKIGKDVIRESQQAQNAGDEAAQSRAIRQKLQNKFLKQKKLKEEEKQKREEQEEKKRQQRDKQIKALLEKHRQKQQQMERQKQKNKKQEATKQQEEKKKREKYQEDLKKKVDQFMQKKKEEKNKEEENKRKKKEMDHNNLQKLKKDVSKKKKMVEESKQKKKQEEEAKLNQSIAKKKKIDEENKIKLAEQKEKTKKLLQQYKERKIKQRQQKGSPQQSPQQLKEKLIQKTQKAQKNKDSTTNIQKQISVQSASKINPPE